MQIIEGGLALLRGTLSELLFKRTFIGPEP